jgi:hypothetical protein
MGLSSADHESRSLVDPHAQNAGIAKHGAEKAVLALPD